MPCCCWIKNCLHVHLKGFSIIKGTVRLGWKLLHCWLKHPAPSLPLSEHSSMMTHVLIIGSCHIWCSHPHQKSHVEMQKCSKKQRKEKGNRLPGLVMSGRSRKRLTLPSLLSPFRSPPGYKEDCVAALCLWLADIHWELVQKLILFIYIHCAWRSHRGDKAVSAALVSG